MAALRAGVSLAALLLPATLHAAKPVAAPVATAAAPAPPSVKAGVERWRANDYAGAVAIWQVFAANGDADAMFNMGQAYKLGRGVAADAATARDYYRRAAAKGHLPAQANLGIALFQVGQKAEAIKWLRTAADRGEARAQYVLGIAAYNGDGLPRSQAVGYAYLTRAQASGLPQATAALGSISPALSPTDRTAGEAIAASIASGNGVPSVFAPPVASASFAAPRLTIPAGSGVTKPPVQIAAATPAPQTAVAPIVATPPPAVVARAGAAPVTTPSPAPTPLRAPATASTATALPVATPAPSPVPVRGPAPTPAQTPPLDTGARPATSPPIAVATTSIPASRPVVGPAFTAAERVPPADVAKPAPKPAAAKPVQTAALKPFETIIPAKAEPKKPGWRVQLGAFSARKQADTAWAAAKADAGAAKPIFNADGPVVKLQIGPFATRDKAKAACAKLSDAGRSCFVTEG